MDDHTRLMPSAALVDPADVAPVAPIQPLGLSIGDAVKVSGCSRSGLYRAASRGEIIFLKFGDRVIVDFASLKAHHARLRRATLSITDA
jgi:hypothetical protein